VNDWAATFRADLLEHDRGSDRSQQAQSGILGPSDLVCRERARRVTIGAVPDRESSSLAAILGTAIHKGIQEARAAVNPNLRHEVEVSITLPSGVVITGHADEVDVDENSVTDFKTVADLAYRKRIGVDENHVRQVTLYALGLVQAGVLKPDPLIRVAYLDRSGRDELPFVVELPFDETNVRFSDAFIEDIIYAVKHNEEASKDWPREMCRRFCQFYFSCRRDDTPSGRIEGEPAAAAGVYVEANEAIKKWTAVKEGARQHLDGVEGVTDDGVVVRWVEIMREEGPFQRIDVRKSVQTPPAGDVSREDVSGGVPW